MTDEKSKKQSISNDIFIADIMLRLTAIEKLLISKGVFTVEELTATTDEIAKNVTKVVLEKAKNSKDLEEFINDFNVKDKEFKN